MEIWKKIEGYDGYEVSNYGRVRTNGKITHTDKHGYRHWKDRVLKQKITNTNCYRVDLWKDGKVKSFLVHRLVASAFLGMPENEKMTVNHKDGNRLNNHIDNLEWLSLADNIRHAFRNGLMAEENCMLIGENGSENHYYSLAEASRSIGRNSAYISNCKKFDRPIKDKDGKTYILFE